ncbi:hypothetical protein VPNG_02651 [Cytospora leucostoma]|uniref:Uncharacterized protein n=1 Tax=Cytospora leucostoma TaxID=1230097 RepID=A0A423XHW9_9PEZI|nr:hypothetical protein VPNG_02651 [Cytospora leucostoma]
MQFTTLFSIVTSVTLASAGIIQNRGNSSENVAIFRVYDQYTTECPYEDGSVIEVGPKAVDLCIPFAEPYPSVKLTGLQDGYSAQLFKTADCATGNNELVEYVPGGCSSGQGDDEPWVAYRISPDTA